MPPFHYVALNPVRARLVARAEDWAWSSVHAHQVGRTDAIVAVEPLLERVGNFAVFLSEDFDEAMTHAALRKAESVGRPIGSKAWIADMEARTGLILTPAKRWPAPRGRPV
jgi:putative transposase